MNSQSYPDKPAGFITTVVGGGVLSYLSDPTGLAVDPDGSICIAENDHDRYSNGVDREERFVMS